MNAWRANLHSRYWFVGSDLMVYSEIDTHDEFDNRRYEAGNYFSTRTEATKIARWIYAGIAYIRGGCMNEAIERWVEARYLTEKVIASRSGS